MNGDVTSISLPTSRANSFRLVRNDVKYCFEDEELKHVAKNGDIQGCRP